MKKIASVSMLLVLLLISNINAKPQVPEINDQYQTTNPPIPTSIDVLEKNITVEENEINASERRLDDGSLAPSIPIHTKFYRAIYAPIDAFFSAPKVIAVLRNVGTCIVNGAMELISFYFPAPMIPLIASAAGMVIPFEPVVMLRDRMPVNSYRRAFVSAVRSFLGTFDRYKIDDNLIDDPYMMQRFSRRFMSDPKNEDVKTN